MEVAAEVRGCGVAALCRARDTALTARMERAGQQFSLAAAALDAMSPLRVLERGYAIAQDANGAILRETKTVAAGDALRLRLWKGTLDCRVEVVTEPAEDST